MYYSEEAFSRLNTINKWWHLVTVPVCWINDGATIEHPSVLPAGAVPSAPPPVFSTFVPPAGSVRSHVFYFHTSISESLKFIWGFLWAWIPSKTGGSLRCWFSLLIWFQHRTAPDVFPLRQKSSSVCTPGEGKTRCWSVQLGRQCCTKSICQTRLSWNRKCLRGPQMATVFHSLATHFPGEFQQVLWTVCVFVCVCVSVSVQGRSVLICSWSLSVGGKLRELWSKCRCLQPGF